MAMALPCRPCPPQTMKPLGSGLMAFHYGGHLYSSTCCRNGAGVRGAIVRCLGNHGRWSGLEAKPRLVNKRAHGIVSKTELPEVSLVGRFSVPQSAFSSGCSVKGTRVLCFSSSASDSKEKNLVSPAPVKKTRARKKTHKPSEGSAKLPHERVKDDANKHVDEEGKAVVVVESPAKAKTIGKYLGENYIVLASYGHVRDLAARSGSVRPKEDFAFVWEVPTAAQERLDKIKSALNGARRLLLASDPDREGEAIAWHVYEMMKMDGILERENIQVRRVSFNEITKSAIEGAMRAPRDISEMLVHAYLARRALDYLIGFGLSPILWRKLPGSKSAGRVQSAALNLICEREAEIDVFVPREYWTVEAEFHDNDKNLILVAKLVQFKGQKLEQFSLTSSEAKAAAKSIEKSKLRVSDVKKSMMKRNAPGPYITSTLQQDGSSKLGFRATQTMALAQQLYEGIKLTDDEIVGLITYMRTDSQQLSTEAVKDIRSFITERYGEEFVPLQPKQYKSKVKNAQESHEAIRPTDIRRTPSMLANALEPDALRLYTMIWCRTMQCQMEQAILNNVAVEIADRSDIVKLRATGSTVSFPGYKIVLQDKDALGSLKEELDGDEGNKLPSFEAGDLLLLKGVQPKQHFTEPPPRYTEGSLIKKLEDLGIGRPSTYASIIRILQAREYMSTEKQRIFAKIRGRMVTAFLSRSFPDLIDYGFTAKMEEQLDEISAGRLEWKNTLKEFWPAFQEKITAASAVPNEQVRQMLEELFSDKFFNGLGAAGRTCPSCNQGKLTLKLSRFGTGYFLGCSCYPGCAYKMNVLPLPDDDEEEVSEASTLPSSPPKHSTEDRILGLDPKSGLQVTAKVGPFGPYLQLGEATTKQKPRRTTIPKNIKFEDIDLDTALDLLKYPFELGKHPEDGSSVMVSIGQRGCFIRHRMTLVSLDGRLEDLTLEKAADLLKGTTAKQMGRKKGSTKKKVTERRQKGDEESVEERDVKEDALEACV